MLLLLTWTYGDEIFKFKQEVQMINKQIYSVIQNSIRASYVFTKYSENQFLILLFGSIKEGTEREAERLNRRLKGKKLNIVNSFEVREICEH